MGIYYGCSKVVYYSIERVIDIINLCLLLPEEEMILMKTKEVVILFGLLSS